MTINVTKGRHSIRRPKRRSDYPVAPVDPVVEVIHPEELKDSDGISIPVEQYLKTRSQDQNVPYYDGGSSFGFPRLGLDIDEMRIFVRGLERIVDEIVTAYDARR